MDANEVAVPWEAVGSIPVRKSYAGQRHLEMQRNAEWIRTIACSRQGSQPFSSIQPSMSYVSSRLSWGLGVGEQEVLWFDSLLGGINRGTLSSGDRSS